MPLPASAEARPSRTGQLYHSANATEFISDAVNNSIASRFVRIPPSNILSDYHAIITPYSPDAFEKALRMLGLNPIYPNLIHHLRHGFPMGDFGPICKTTIFTNDPSVELYRT